MTPIGRGQRELIIGDRKTGKTAVALDTIINQKGGDVICIYVACGQRASSTAGVVEVLREHGALDYTIVVSATASDPAPLQYVAPYAGAAMAEHFMWQGKHTLVIYDDLSKQAQAYRQLSLLDAAAPGTRGVSRRRLLLPQPTARAGLQAERRARRRIDDGLADHRNAGRRSLGLHSDQRDFDHRRADLPRARLCSSQACDPAINVGISVSRVGGNAQTKAMKRVAGSLRLDLAAFRELEAFAQLGTELDKATQRQLDRGYRMVELLKQPQYEPRHVADQVIAHLRRHARLLRQGSRSSDVARAEKELMAFMKDDKSDVRNKIVETGALDDATMAELRTALEEFAKAWADSHELVEAK